jgi:predicted nucleic acid-binding Zn finger protein
LKNPEDKMLEGIESKREELASRFARYRSDNHSQFEKAIETVLGGCVKKHVFLPSGRSIYTVVGSKADEFIDSETPFCSCESYFYGVLSGRIERCYHILSYKIADEAGLIQEVEFADQEYDTFLQLLASDVLRSRERKKPS